jgi:hypothetical protein
VSAIYETPRRPLSESELVALLLDEAHDEPIETTLRTDDRVIARVTDGIYRQPGSALRELISNAYDADASHVIIRTDRPRFQRMVIEDDGIGMSPQALGHLLHHIGGSAKRTTSGVHLGITSAVDPTRSPGGRPLIGKIGIGLFSVAQLTQGFQVITKVKGDDKQTIASVLLKQYSEQVQPEDDREYEAGRVLVWREPAHNTRAHGTTIVLDAIRPQTRETLRSTEIWDAIFGNRESVEQGQAEVRPPRFHIGTVQAKDQDLLEVEPGQPHLPWDSDDPPDKAFRKLVDAVWDTGHYGIPNPRLENLFDYYLNMIWELSLWCPLPYIDIHPFDIRYDGRTRTFEFTDRGRAAEFSLTGDESVRQAANLGDRVRSASDFSVTIDDLGLRRPIRMRDLPATSNAVKTPLLFVADEYQGFPEVDVEISGGPLAFQAYLLWAPKIVPTDHQGVLIRVHDATGSMFDPTFLNFPVSEQRRMTQITCEVFITQGFDGAINIDRESFNYAHPHVVTLTRWLHESLRRLIAIEKRIAADALEKRRSAGAERTKHQADEVVQDLWRKARSEDGTEPPAVAFTDRLNSERTEQDSYSFPRSEVIGEYSGPNSRQRRANAEDRLAKIVQVLAAFEVLDHLMPEEQANMLAAISEILRAYDS